MDTLWSLAKRIVGNMVKEVGVMIPLIFFSMEWIFKRHVSKSTLIFMCLGGIGLEVAYLAGMERT